MLEPFDVSPPRTTRRPRPWRTPTTRCGRSRAAGRRPASTCRSPGRRQVDLGLRDERAVVTVLAANGIDHAAEDGRPEVVARVRQRRPGDPARRGVREVELPVLADVGGARGVGAAEVVQPAVPVLELARGADERQVGHARVRVGDRVVAPDLPRPEDLPGARCVGRVAARPVDECAVCRHAGVRHAAPAGPGLCRHRRGRRPAGGWIHAVRARRRRAAGLREVESAERVQLRRIRLHEGLLHADGARYRMDPSTGWTASAPMPAQNGTGRGGVTHAGMATDGTSSTGRAATRPTQRAPGRSSGRGRSGATTRSPTRTRAARPAADPRRGELEYLNGGLHYFGGTNSTRTADVGEHWELDLANTAAAGSPGRRCLTRAPPRVDRPRRRDLCRWRPARSRQRARHADPGRPLRPGDRHVDAGHRPAARDRPHRVVGLRHGRAPRRPRW